MNFELTTFWVNILLPILSILIPVFATLYTVNNRIKAQNKENHQPYVVLDSVVDIDKINEFSYYLTPVGREYKKENPVIDYDNILLATLDKNEKIVVYEKNYEKKDNVLN